MGQIGLSTSWIAPKKVEKAPKVELKAVSKKKPEPQSSDLKVFQIGFNKCATRSIRQEFDPPATDAG